MHEKILWNPQTFCVFSYSVQKEDADRLCHNYKLK